jgi:hypothetical protein
MAKISKAPRTLLDLGTAHAAYVDGIGRIDNAGQFRI